MSASQYYETYELKIDGAYVVSFDDIDDAEIEEILLQEAA